MVSGIFRQTLWNQSIPDAMRGRLAGWNCGLICVGAVATVCALLPGFVRYKAEPGSAEPAPEDA